MRDKDLLEKRVYPALKEMYEKAEPSFPREELPADFDFSFENLSRFAPFEDEAKKRRQFPLDFFHLSSDETNEITKRYIKHLRYYYQFPYRTEWVFSDEEIEKMKARVEKLKAENSEDQWQIKDIEEKIKWNPEHKRRNALWDEYYKKWQRIDKDFKKKKFNRKEYKKRMMELYKKYGCTKRSRDAEAVQFEIFNYSPNTSIEFHEAMKKAYAGEDFDCNNKERVLESVKLCRDFVNNIKNNTPTYHGKE
jgi:hypothetical protein